MRFASLLIGLALAVGGLCRSYAGGQAGAPPPRLALLVGISDYDQTRPLPWRRLHGRRDVEELRRVLIERFGFVSPDIKVLIDSDATTDGIRKAFRIHLIERAVPGAVIVFHFSGHGQQVPDDDGDELDGLDESLVTYDAKSQRAADGAQTNLRDDELGRLLSELRARVNVAGRPPGSITVSLDSCASATGSRTLEPGLLVERGRPWDEALDGPRPPERHKGKVKGQVNWLLAGEAAARGYIFLSASQSNRTAKEVGDMGAFSLALVQALRGAKEATTYRDLFEQITVEMANTVREQVPQIEGDADLLLFRGLARPTTAHLLVTRVEGNKVTLPIGMLHGATVGSRFALYGAGANVGDARAQLAEAVIEKVEEATCTAVLTPENRNPAPDLTAARAIEVEHRFADHPLLLYVAGEKREVEQALAGFEVAQMEGASREHRDLRIETDGAGRLTLTRWSETVPLVALDVNPSLGARLREVLRREWRWHFVLRLNNPGSAARIDLRVVPVSAQTNAAGRVTTPPSLRTDVKSSGTLSFGEGEFFMLELRNRGREDLYVNVFDLSPSGAIGPLFPHPLVSGDNLIPADGRARLLPLPFVFRVKHPFGRWLVKLIATRSQVDFSPILQESVAGERYGELLQQIPAEMNPLARLLYSAATGTRVGVLSGVVPSRWTTSHVWYEVHPPAR